MVENSVFDTEFVDLKQGIEAVRCIRYKVNMIQTPIWGPKYIYGDNISVTSNISEPESTLKRRV